MSRRKPHRLLTECAEGYPEARAIIEAIANGEMPEGARCIYAGSRNQLYLFPSEYGALVVKCFCRPNVVNSVAYTTLRRSKACRSFLNSQALQHLGIDVPAPLAYAEERRGIRLGRSWYLSKAVAGDTIRFYEMRPDCDPMLRALALSMLRMHLSGVLHKDFSPGNAIVHRKEDGDYLINYVDLNRMAWDVTDHAKQMRMFERINYSEMHTRRLARAYARLLPRPVRTYADLNLIDYSQLFGSRRDILQGLYPMLRNDALIRRGERYIETEAVKAFRRFWHSRHRKKRLTHPFRKN